MSPPWALFAYQRPIAQGRDIALLITVRDDAVAFYRKLGFEETGATLPDAVPMRQLSEDQDPE